MARTRHKLAARGLHGHPKITGVRGDVMDVVSLPMSNRVTHVTTNSRTRGRGEEDSCAGGDVASCVLLCLAAWNGVKTEGEAGGR